MRYIASAVLLTLAGCAINTTVPLGDAMSQQQKQSQTNKQEQSQTNQQTASTAADQQSSHASDSKQGTNSMPIIVICNQLNAPRATCVTPQQPLSNSIKDLQK